MSFFSRRAGFESHHLELAGRVFDRLMPGGFLALDRRASDLVRPAVAQWMTTPPGRGREPEPAGEPEDVGERALT